MAQDSADSAGKGRKRGPGRPFAKGRSGNPGGRPRGIVRRVKELVGEDGEKALRILWDIAQGKVSIPMVSMAGTPYDAEPPFKDRIEALKELLARGFGKAPDKIELSGPDGQPIETKGSAADVEKLDALLARVERLTAGG